MKVLHVYSGNLYGGVETLLVTIARQQMVRLTFESEFALAFEGRLAEELDACGAFVHRIGSVRVSRPISVWRARRALRAVIDRGGYDVVVCHSPWPQALFGSVARQAGVPLVFWLHDAFDGRHWIERLAGRTPPDLVIANSNFTAGTVRAVYSNVLVETLFYPVPPPIHTSETRADRAAVRRELNTAPDATVIVQVSRMEAWKGHLIHLEALGQLRAVPGWTCWFVGGAQRGVEARYVGQLEATAAALGMADRIRFVGQRSDVSRILHAADIFCQPNAGPEPFGIAFVEALHCALPVITAAMGGPKEIVDDTCGILTRPGDAVAVANALRGLIEDRARRASLAAGGPARARALCDPEQQLDTLYETLARVSRRGARTIVPLHTAARAELARRRGSTRVAH